MKKLVAFFMCLLFVGIGISLVSAAPTEESIAHGSIDHYEYPIDKNSEDWFDYSVLQKVEMLKIPEETLRKLTDEALIAAIAEYPYLCDLYVYGYGVADGIEVSSTYFSALAELVSRDNAVELLKTYGMTTAQGYFDAALASSVEADANHNTFVGYALCDLLMALDSSVHVSYTENDDGYVINATVTTPNGTSVPHLTRTESHTESYI